jgi:DUF4097 and DUF4098 domain-containing protein YvlB
MATNPFQLKEGTPVLKESLQSKNAKQSILRWGSFSLLLLPLVAVNAASQSRQEKTFDTTANPRVSLSNFMGHVVVKSWDKSQVHAVYNTASPQITVDMDQLPSNGAAEKIHFTTHAPSSQPATQDKTVYYTLDVPVGASLEIRNPEGRVDIEKLQGDAVVDSVGGGIYVTDVNGHIAATSVAGDIEIIRSAGRVEANSICGNLHFVSPTGSALKSHTASGKIVFEGDFVSGGEYSFTSYGGNIDLFVPPTASFELNKNTVRGIFGSDIHAMKREHEYAPSAQSAHSLFGRNVSSTATLRLSSYSGNIYIHSKP